MPRTLPLFAAVLLAGGLHAADPLLQIEAKVGPPLVFETVESVVTETPTGLRAEGKVGLGTPVGTLDLARSDLRLDYGPAGKAGGFQTFHGVSEVPFPQVGLFEGFEITSPSRAEVSYLPGGQLGHLGVPLQKDRSYMAWRILQGFGGKLGDFELSVPGGKEAIMVLDPADPFLFVTGDLPGLADIGGIEELGIGVSAQGLIPFEARTRWSLDRRTPTFTGHLYLKGKVPLKQYGMAIRGETVVRLDRIGAPVPGLSQLVPTAVGGNGTLLLVVPLLEFIDFEMELGNASAAAIYRGARSAAYFSGVGKPKVPFLPDDLPVMPEREIKVAGMIDGVRLQDSFLRAEGQYVMGLARLADLVGIELENMKETRGSFSISRKGFVVQGISKSQFTPLIKVQGSTTVRSYFSVKEPTKDFSVRLSGAFGVGGIPLGADALVELGPKKAHVKGTLQTPLNAIALEGKLSKGGLLLKGMAELKVPIRGATKVVNTVTNGAICGYHVVKDGAKCGFDQVTDSAVCGTKVVVDGGKCGVDWVTDGTVCGWTKVTDGAVCGWTKVTDGAVCGWTKVTDGAVCGWTKVTDGAKCGWEWTKVLLNPLKWGKIKKPKTCKQARSCNKPRSCNQPRTCNQPRRCQKPRKCTIAATCKVARSCKDLSKPRTCQQVVNIPDAHLGDFSAKIEVEVTHKGAGGAVSGTYCTGKGKCLTLAGGRVKFDPKPEACIDFPGLGERCFGF